MAQCALFDEVMSDDGHCATKEAIIIMAMEQPLLSTLDPLSLRFVQAVHQASGVHCLVRLEEILDVEKDCVKRDIGVNVTRVSTVCAITKTRRVSDTRWKASQRMNRTIGRFLVCLWCKNTHGGGSSGAKAGNRLFCIKSPYLQRHAAVHIMPPSSAWQTQLPIPSTDCPRLQTTSFECSQASGTASAACVAFGGALSAADGIYIGDARSTSCASMAAACVANTAACAAAACVANTAACAAAVAYVCPFCHPPSSPTTSRLRTAASLFQGAVLDISPSEMAIFDVCAPKATTLRRSNEVDAFAEAPEGSANGTFTTQRVRIRDAGGDSLDVGADFDTEDLRCIASNLEDSWSDVHMDVAFSTEDAFLEELESMYEEVKMVENDRCESNDVMYDSSMEYPAGVSAIQQAYAACAW